ncbi:MAG: hypothetical protein AAF960_13505 [Bacteroidota bacterium]
MKKQLSFSDITFKQLRQFVNLRPSVEVSVFVKWFEIDYTISQEEITFLQSLIDRNRIRIPHYSEEELKMQFIAPLIHKVNFNFGEVSNWYERQIRATINGIELKGLTDYLVARGIFEPETPYFFIQEFKPSKRASDPEIQLIAELIVAMKLSESTEMLGATIVGKVWDFILVKKLADNDYVFYKSDGFNVLNIEDLKKLYIALQGVKADIKSKVGFSAGDTFPVSSAF